MKTNSSSPVALLFEDNIYPQDIKCFEINFHKVFYETEGDLHFDIFAATFYLLSRYEEYVHHKRTSTAATTIKTHLLSVRDFFISLLLISGSTELKKMHSGLNSPTLNTKANNLRISSPTILILPIHIYTKDY